MTKVVINVEFAVSTPASSATPMPYDSLALQCIMYGFPQDAHASQDLVYESPQLQRLRTTPGSSICRHAQQLFKDIPQLNSQISLPHMHLSNQFRMVVIDVEFAVSALASPGMPTLYDILSSQCIMDGSQRGALGVPGVSEFNVAGAWTPPNTVWRNSDIRTNPQAFNALS